MDGLEQTRALDERIAELADGQHGVVARRQLLALGVGEEAIEVRLRAGRLHRLHRGVYAVGHRVLSREARWMAAVLFAGPDAVLSHRSAAALWGMPAPSSRAIEVTTPRKSRSRGSIHRHFAVLPADEVTTERGIPVTTVPRTLFDLAATSSVDVVEHALRESEYLRLHDRLSLPDLLARYPGRRGSHDGAGVPVAPPESPGRPRSQLARAASSCRSCGATVCHDRGSTSGWRWEGGRSRSTASGPVRWSSNSMGSRGTAPGSPSGRIGLAIGGCEWPGTA